MVCLPETKTAKKHLKMDGWKRMSFLSIWGWLSWFELLVSSYHRQSPTTRHKNYPPSRNKGEKRGSLWPVLGWGPVLGKGPWGSSFFHWIWGKIWKRQLLGHKQDGDFGFLDGERGSNTPKMTEKVDMPPTRLTWNWKNTWSLKGRWTLLIKGVILRFQRVY